MKSVFATLMAASMGFSMAIAGQTQPESLPEAQAPKVAREGDIITLRSGKSLQGVRVLSETQLEVTVEVLPDLPPLKLPASQVTSIQYGHRHDSPTLSESPELMVPDTSDEDSVLLPALRLELEFSKRLEDAMGPGLAGRQAGDVVDLFRRVEKQKKIPIDIDTAILSRPSTQRQCVIAIDAEETVDSFFRDSVTGAASWLQINYTFDRVVVSLKRE